LSAISPSSLTDARRPLDDVCSCLSFRPSPPLPNSSGIISFADPHPLNSIESYRSKIMGGGLAPSRRSDVPRYFDISPFLSSPCALFCALLHFLALTQNSTLLFSANSALFAQKREVGRPRKADHSTPIPYSPPHPLSMLLYIVTSLLLSFSHD
jgi:hypothetical protein